MPKQPLAEVFGYPINNNSVDAIRFREKKLCPFNNKVPNCTKDKVDNPLGVCSIFEDDETAITCPIRFRQEWIIVDSAAEFFFPAGTKWTSFTEVRLEDIDGKAAGNIDVVLVSYDDSGKVLDFGALEIQAVYITGNVRNPFEEFMKNRSENYQFSWRNQKSYPKPDYLSSSRKRLAPQLIYKGGILTRWKKKLAVAVDNGFYNTLPKLPQVSISEAEIAWMVYDLVFDERENKFRLSLMSTKYTMFEPALLSLTKTEPGPVESFLEKLQTKLAEKLEDNGSQNGDSSLSALLNE